ncbi:hypothetical protein MSAN_02109000 [Mycena sanguinolenta]|uniref:DUF6534 domain-containing protein n=1 Tax=Mycena sanguinolenta TaxID=230812 RepID=A0A8H6XHJ5_9AGAR|nr:hypothetical protein MSAN_02109000 [Mycena sanguinolenta]
MDSLPPDELAAFVSAIKEALGTIFIGFTIATTLYGITVLQTYLYFKHYSKDPILLKGFVFVLWVLDTFTTILVAHSLYTYLVLNATDLQNDAAIPWRSRSFAAENEVVDIITLFVQCFFGRQVFRFSRSKIISGIIFSLSLAAFSMDIKVTSELFATLSISALSAPKVFILGSIVQGLSALCDIVITVSLIYYLRGSKRGIMKLKPTSTLIDTLILYAITRGTATAICQLMFMILNVTFPNDTFWQPFHQAVGKLYVNSVLASLNFRASPTTGSPAIPLWNRDRTVALATESGIASTGATSTLAFNTSRIGSKFEASNIEHDVDLAKSEGDV